MFLKLVLHLASHLVKMFVTVLWSLVDPTISLGTRRLPTAKPVAYASPLGSKTRPARITGMRQLRRPLD